MTAEEVLGGFGFWIYFESLISSYGVKEKMKLRTIQVFDLYEQKNGDERCEMGKPLKKISFEGKIRSLVLDILRL